VTRTVTFTREQLRTPFVLVLLIAIPAVFVVAAAGVLGEFGRALGGNLTGDAATALAAGWAAAFIAGAAGYFQSESAHEADRRLALSGLGTARVALARIGAAVALALVASAAGFAALMLRAGVAHPAHAAAAVLAFALVYLAIGIVVGSLLHDPLAGSLFVVFVFLLDVFSGPGMSEHAAPWSVSRKAADVLIAAATGHGSPAADWLRLGAVVVAALATSLAVFMWSARSRA
jgi:hypothetical protein